MTPILFKRRAIVAFLLIFGAALPAALVPDPAQGQGQAPAQGQPWAQGQGQGQGQGQAPAQGQPWAQGQGQGQAAAQGQAWAQGPGHAPVQGRAPVQMQAAQQGQAAPNAPIVDKNDITQLKAGRAAFEARHFDQALQAFYLFRELRPRNLSVHFWLGTTLEALGRDEEAEKEYELCLQLSATLGLDSAEMRNNLASVLVRRGYTKEPLFDYKRASLIDPRCAPPYLGLAKCLIEAGNFDEALVALNNYQHVGGQDINALLLHGLALAGKDQYAPARQDLTNFINAAQNGGNNQPLDKDWSSFRRKYVTTGGVSPGAIDLARRMLNEMQQRQ